MRIWFKEWKKNRMVKDLVIEDDSEDTRTHKIFHALEQACYELDLSVPNWLDVNIRQFQKNAKTRFTQDNFIDEIPFDHLEVQVIEE